MRWFTRALQASLYPGAPFERKFLAMLLLNTLVAVWAIPDKSVRGGSQPARREAPPVRLLHGWESHVEQVALL